MKDFPLLFKFYEIPNIIKTDLLIKGSNAAQNYLAAAAKFYISHNHQMKIWNRLRSEVYQMRPVFVVLANVYSGHQKQN